MVLDEDYWIVLDMQGVPLLILGFAFPLLG